MNPNVRSWTLLVNLIGNPSLDGIMVDEQPEATPLIGQFRQFAVSAESVLRSSAPPTLRDEFQQFIDLSQRILSRDQSSHPIDQFRQFVELSMPLVVAEIKRQLPTLADLASLASRWLVQHDLLYIARYSGVENSYTELMAWALDPATHLPSAITRQQAWLKGVGIEMIPFGAEPCVPRTQLDTDDGIPDLVLRFPNKTVVVEAKTGTAEHAAPSGLPQTDAYPKAVRRKFELPVDAPIEIVFITPDRRAASNPEAKITTFVEFALCLARALRSEELPTDTRAAYALMFTHFLTCSVPSKVPVKALVEEVVKWSSESDWMNDEQILVRRDHLLAALQLFQPENPNVQ